MIGLIIGPFLVGMGIGGAVAFLYIKYKNKKAKEFVMKELNKKEVKPNAEGKETNSGTISEGEQSTEESSAEDECKGTSIKQEGDELPTDNGTE